MEFQVETLDQCVAEIVPILRHEHWEEVGHYKDIVIDMDWARYRALEHAGALRCFTARTYVDESFTENELAGYAFFLVDRHLHYKNTLVASQDILYVRKPFRGFGKSFIRWCDDQLRAEGVVTVTHHVKPWFDFSGMLERQGYEKAETIWSRRLD